MQKLMMIGMILLSDSLQATEIEIRFNNFQSKIVSTSSFLSYKDTNTDLSLKAKKCNAHIIKNIDNLLIKNSRQLIKEEVKDHPMTLIVDQEKWVIDQRSKKGQFYHHFIEVIKQAKVEESLNCQ